MGKKRSSSICTNTDLIDLQLKVHLLSPSQSLSHPAASTLSLLRCYLPPSALSPSANALSLCLRSLSRPNFPAEEQRRPGAKDFLAGTFSSTHERIIPIGTFSVYNFSSNHSCITAILSSVFVWSFQIGFRFSFTGTTA
jgi:hypothetical protein